MFWLKHICMNPVNLARSLKAPTLRPFQGVQKYSISPSMVFVILNKQWAWNVWKSQRMSFYVAGKQLALSDFKLHWQSTAANRQCILDQQQSFACQFVFTQSVSLYSSVLLMAFVSFFLCCHTEQKCHARCSSFDTLLKIIPPLDPEFDILLMFFYTKVCYRTKAR